MKKNLIIFFCIIANTCSFAQSTEVNIDYLKAKKDKKIRVFFTALWCSPCMGKYKKIIQEFKTDTTYNNYVVFDALGYNIAKLQRIEPAFYDTSKTFFIPFKYYKTSKLININLQQKALKKFMADFKTKFNSETDFTNFWYGEMITIGLDNKLEINKIAL